MKLASLIVAVVLALATGTPAKTAPLAVAPGAAAVTAAPSAIGPTVDTNSTRRNNDDDAASAAPGPSTYVLLALGLFGMGLVSRRRQAD